MKDLFKKFAYTSFFISGVLFTFLIIGVGYISREIIWGTPVQTLDSQTHSATLRRAFGIADYNLVVEVDGERVYYSGDIVGFSERQLRATLVWDKTGRVIAFERMGKIYFAYDAQERREIRIDELKQYCLSPMPDNYYLSENKNCKE